MRKESHTRIALIVSVALFTSLALPVTVLFSREDEPTPEAVHAVELVAAIPAPRGLAHAPDPLPDDAAQSVSMVLVGSLLIGLGSIIRRSV
jgi:hypothetical protein